MTSVHRRDRLRFGFLVGAYVLTSVGTLAAVLMVWVTVARPPSVVVIDAERRARLVLSTARPTVTAPYVESFGRHFAQFVAVEDWLTGSQKRERALEMMSVPLERYERSEERANIEAIHQAALKERRVSGHVLSVDSACRPNSSRRWVCVVQGEAGYRVGEAKSPLVRRPFSVHMHVDELRVTKRSPYGLLVSAFQVTRDSGAEPTPTAAKEERKVRGARE